MTYLSSISFGPRQVLLMPGALYEMSDKYRGKRKDNGEWVYGDVFNEDPFDPHGKVFIMQHDKCQYTEYDNDNGPPGAICKEIYGDIYEVIPETVGRWTGYNDKNGVEIWEGDVVRYVGGDIESGAGVVENISRTCNLAFRWITQDTSSPSLYTHCDYFGCAAELEIVGNIHENPSLLDKK